MLQIHHQKNGTRGVTITAELTMKSISHMDDIEVIDRSIEILKEEKRQIKEQRKRRQNGR